MNEDVKLIGFAAIVCLVCSLLLAGVYSALKPMQDLNAKLDVKTKVLKTFGVKVADEKGRPLLSPAEVEKTFAGQVESRVLDREGNLVDVKVEELTPEDINERDKAHGNLKKYYPYYIFTDSAGHKRYAIHVSGMGLWSVVKGYIALEEDLETIAGIAIYDHAETPGLGGEVDKDWFQKQFVGRKLAEAGEAKYFRVVKAGEKTDPYSVGGISGSTMTGNGMTKFINSDYAVYRKHFDGLKKGKG